MFKSEVSTVTSGRSLIFGSALLHQFGDAFHALAVLEQRAVIAVLDPIQDDFGTGGEQDNGAAGSHSRHVLLPHGTPPPQEMIRGSPWAQLWSKAVSQVRK